MLSQSLPQLTAALFGLTFVEGMLAFVSPCILPLLPLYLVYLGGKPGLLQRRARKTLLWNTVGFIAGFTLVFVLLGASASALGQIFTAHRLLLERISGLVMIVFGLNYLGVFKLGFLTSAIRQGRRKSASGLSFTTSLVFGSTFAFSWTPCLTAFLGSALLFASNAATLYQGMALLLMFSLGLGLPFFLTALLWDYLHGTISWVKRNFRGIQIVSGGLLIIAGILMVGGWFQYYNRLFL